MKITQLNFNIFIFFSTKRKTFLLGWLFVDVGLFRLTRTIVVQRSHLFVAINGHIPTVSVFLSNNKINCEQQQQLADVDTRTIARVDKSANARWRYYIFIFLLFCFSFFHRTCDIFTPHYSRSIFAIGTHTRWVITNDLIKTENPVGCCGKNRPISHAYIISSYI